MITTNVQNLLTDDRHRFTLEELSRGGKASAEARRQKRELRRALESLLEKDFTDEQGNTLTGAQKLAAALFAKALKGNVTAFLAVRSTVGQDPVQKFMISEVDPEIVREVETMVLNESDDVSE